MKGKDVAITLGVLVVIVIVVVFLIKKFVKDAVSTGGDIIQDTIHGTPLGWVAGIRGVKGEKAEGDIKKMPFLTEAFYEKANNVFNTSFYKLDYMGTSASNDIARKVANANSWIPGGFFDDNVKAVTELEKIKNIVQAAEVARSYYLTTGHDLGKSLGWLNDNSIVELADYFTKLQSLPSGVTTSSGDAVPYSVILNYINPKPQ